MEINRKLLRRNAWNALKGIYWFMFLICILAGLIGAVNGGSSNIGISIGSNNTAITDSSDTLPSSPDELKSMLENRIYSFTKELDNDFGLRVTLIIILSVIVLSALFMLLFRIFISGPAEISFAKLKLSAVVERNKDANLAFYAFKNGYKNMVKTTFLRSLYLILWRLLPCIVSVPVAIGAVAALLSGRLTFAVILIVISGVAAIALSVPAIVKSYSYMLVPYILADNPSLRAKDAIRRSIELMDGFKWQTFVLQLSFIGWYILGALCCGVGMLFVAPYYHCTEALLYEELNAYRSTPAAPEAVALPETEAEVPAPEVTEEPVAEPEVSEEPETTEENE